MMHGASTGIIWLLSYGDVDLTVLQVAISG